MGLGATHAKFWETIESKGIENAASDAGCSAGRAAIIVPIAGSEHRVFPSTRTITGPDGKPAKFLESVVAVTYLATASGRALSGEWVSEKMLPLGDVYFRGNHSIPFGILLPRYAPNPAAFAGAAARAGGRALSFGDAGAEIPALPRVPMRIGLWKADEEFPADGRILFDSTACEYLLLDGILTLVNIVFKKLAES